MKTYLVIHLLSKEWGDEKREMRIPEMSTGEEREEIIRTKYPDHIGWLWYYIEDRVGEKVVRQIEGISPPNGTYQLFAKEISFSMMYGSTIEKYIPKGKSNRIKEFLS